MYGSNRQKAIIISAFAVLVIGGSAVAFLVVPKRWAKPSEAKPVPADPSNPNVYIASAEFANKPLGDQMDYIRANREKLDRESMGRMFQQRMQKTVDEWYALPEDQRDAYLDRQIDQWAQMRQRREQEREERQAEREDGERDEENRDNAEERRQRRERGPWGPQADRGEMRQRIRERTEATSPEQRAKMTAFMQAMGRRMAARGMSGGMGGPFRGPR